MTCNRSVFGVVGMFAGFALFPGTTLAQEVELTSLQGKLTSSAMIAKRTYDAAGVDGGSALSIAGDNLTIDFQGAVLVGSNSPDGDQYVGRGISIRGRNITLKNAVVRGYKIGILAEDSPGLRLINCDVSRNYRQRLKSTVEREDLSDWLYGHENDDNEWFRYGAGIYLLRCPDSFVERCRGRHGQNGLCVVGSDRVRVVDCDMSFLSGWGLAMWRSSECEVLSNKFDWCIRGYSHGVYSRGQDSTGILVYEQCHRNVFAHNSATHGGDGFFLYAGNETLHKTGRGGCNGNIVYANDFSHAAANGIEATFSDGNYFLKNTISDCEHGVWAGYSINSVIEGNTIANCKNGISIEHGQKNRITGNFVRRGQLGLHLWFDDDRDLLASEFCRAHDGCPSSRNLVTGNRFEEMETAIRLADDTNSILFDNQTFEVKTPVHLKGNVDGLTWRLKRDQLPAVKNESTGSVRDLQPDDPVINTTWVDPVAADPRLEAPPGSQQAFIPSGALRGRKYIFVDEWGPCDLSELRFVYSHVEGGDRATLQLIGPESLFSIGRVEGRVRVEPDRERLPARISVIATEPGFQRFSVDVKARDRTLTATGTLLRAEWSMAFYRWDAETDPRSHPEAWSKIVSGAPLEQKVVPGLDFTWATNAPSDKVPADRFATVATTSLTLPAGQWRIRTVSDDGVRVFVDGREVLTNWTHHAPTEDVAAVDLSEGAHQFKVDHFEIDGYAQLQFRLAREEP